MEFKGTEKPWSVYIPDHVGCTNVSIGDCNGFNGYVELWYHHYETKEEAKANALLISKAPEMLEMLHKLTKHFKTVSPLYSKDKQLIKESEQLIKEAAEI